MGYGDMICVHIGGRERERGDGEGTHLANI